MRNARVHVAEPPLARTAPGIRLSLSGDRAHHLTRVLRARIGDEIILFDGHGGEFEAVVQSIGRDVVVVVVGRFRDVARESPVPITLGLGLSRGDRMDVSIQKAVELGVAAIVPLATQHAVVRLAGERTERRLAHWRKVVVGACEQSGRTAIPRIVEPVDLGDWLSPPPAAGELRVCLDPVAAPGPPPASRAPSSITLAVGPEGGFSAEERTALAAAGFLALRLGPRTLRTETAAIAAVLVAQLWWGDAGR